MDLSSIKELLDIFDGSSAAELSWEEDNFKIYLSKNTPNAFPQQLYQMPVSPQPIASTPNSAAATINLAHTEQTANQTIEANPNKLYEVKSPIVGTFYRAPSPDAAPFVEAGTKVKPGQTLCIVEAMKLMNEIECDVSGTIEKILLQNAQAVEYGQVLFYIRLD
ncbi:MAG TPA: acetyl-CoA carboxylase biotin carboxyl carrier protein [Candidatus Kapabacteria bacterium]|nr:acetyl-CoA carboxylase biotin carboxyl carrier protein [Candidatus Kapabacteria bacterium]HPO61991.1 acetyl-CoA carboxylase biotin carboxyl carrier protein [Candidatus Kapabacteria bacterium]